MRIQPHTNPSRKERGLTANTIAKAMIISLSLFMSIAASAQGVQSAPGLMRSHLKMYVVVAVLLIIFAGITLFLLSLERRLKKLENNSN